MTGCTAIDELREACSELVHICLTKSGGNFCDSPYCSASAGSTRHRHDTPSTPATASQDAAAVMKAARSSAEGSCAHGGSQLHKRFCSCPHAPDTAKFDPAASGASMSIFARKAACVRLGRDAGSLQLAIQAKLLMHTVAHLQCQPWLHVSVQKAAAFQDLA